MSSALKNRNNLKSGATNREPSVEKDNATPIGGEPSQEGELPLASSRLTMNEDGDGLD